MEVVHNASGKHPAVIFQQDKKSQDRPTSILVRDFYEALAAEIVRLLREERKRRKLSNYAVSQRSGVSQSMLSLVERGLRNPTMELLLRIADGICIDLPTVIKKAQRTLKKSKAI